MRTMRENLNRDKSNFHTFCEEFNTLSFPYIDPKQENFKEKLKAERKQKTKGGMDLLNKRQNWNDLPKPDQATLENLKVPYHMQKQEIKEGLMKTIDPMASISSLGSASKAEFSTNFKATITFSTKDYFNTIFERGEKI